MLVRVPARLRTPVLHSKLFPTLILASCLPLVAADPPILGAEWTYEAREGIVGQPVPVPDAKAARAVLVTLGSGKVHLVDPAGRLLREFLLDEGAIAPALAADLSADGRTEIIALDSWGSVYCFAEDGTRLWKYARESNEGSYRQPVLADVDGNKTLEILVTDSRGRLLVLDAAGRVKLELHVTNYRLSPPAVADLDGDGTAEIIFGTEDKEVYCFDARGELRWVSTADGRFGRTLPLIADLDTDGRYEVYLSSAFVQARPGVFAFDAHDGRPLWKADTKLQSYHSMAAVDLDGDRRLELLFGDKNTSLFAAKAGGAALWSVQLGGRGLFFAPAVARLDAANAAVILAVVRGAGPEGNSLYAIDAAGKTLQGVALPGGGTASPALVRFGQSGELKLLAVGGAGKLLCFRLRQDTTRAQILWAGLRNDANLSGFLPSAGGRAARMPFPALVPLPAAEARFAWHGTNSLNLKQLPKAGTATVRLIRPDQSIQTKVLRLGPGLPAPVLRYEAAASGDYRLEVRWTGSGQLPPPEHYAVNVPADGWKDADRQYRYEPKVEALRARIPERSALIDAILGITRGSLEFATMRGQIRWWDRAADERHYLLDLAEYLTRARPQGDILVTQMPNPWAALDPNAYYKAVQNEPNVLRLQMLGNEYESAALVVTNLKPEPVTLRLAPGGFQMENSPAVPAGRVVTLHEVPAVLPESTGAPAEDVLPQLAEGGLLRLAPLETRKLWLIFRSAELKPGKYRSTLRANDLASSDKPTEIALNLDVLPVRLPVKRIYRHNNWLYLASIADPELRRATMRDALEHGTNVFHVPATTVRLDASGAIAGSDSRVHDELVAELRGKAFFLIGGSVNLAWPKGFHPSKDIATKAFTAAIRWYARHMQSLGVAYDDYALYTQDEPGLMGADANYTEWMQVVRSIKAADPRMKIYANPAGGARSEILAPIASLIDVWQPDLHLYRDQPAELGALFSKATFWNYEAPADQRNLDPLGYYRMKPWVAFQLGMTGGGYWVYSSSDYWAFNRQLSTEYGTVYQTPGGPVTTKRWEASRDGAEDFELLWMLKSRAAAGTPARQLLDEAVSFVTAGQDQVSDISRQLRPYTPSYEKWMQYRARIVEVLSAGGEKAQ